MTTARIRGDARLGGLSARLATLVGAGVLAPLDRRFAEMLARLCPEVASDVLVLAALVSRAPSRGDVCLDLRTPDAGLRLATDDPSLAALGDLRAAARGIAAAPFTRRGRELELRATPLVIDGPRVYLDRLYLAERRVEAAVRTRLVRPAPLDPERGAKLREALERLFGVPATEPTDAMRAVALASRAPFAVITGGPGTGKTTVVVRLLSVLLEQDPTLRIRLLAPTGKAAARMVESIRKQIDGIDSPAKSAIPTEASTIHKALGVNPERPSRTRFHANAPMPVDVVVVDEASMVDVVLMARLFDALPSSARIVLLGDRDQLASVDAGTVLGDLAGGAADRPGISPAMADALAPALAWPAEGVAKRPVAALADVVFELRRSHRFDPEKGIGRLAQAIRSQREADAMAALGSKETPHVRPGARGDVPDALRARVVRAYAEAARAANPRAALDRLDGLRVLCAERSGPDGVEGWNERIGAWLEHEGVVRREGQHFHGRPVMVTQNDYDAQLWNGDVGLVLHDETEGFALRVFFPAEGGGVRKLSPARLPSHETVFAMTIHKSQGSEFDEVVLVLPREPSPILTRELVYTGITRAKRVAHVVADETVLRDAIRREVRRGSGLHDALWRVEGRLLEEEA